MITFLLNCLGRSIEFILLLITKIPFLRKPLDFLKKYPRTCHVLLFWCIVAQLVLTILLAWKQSYSCVLGAITILWMVMIDRYFLRDNDTDDDDDYPEDNDPLPSSPGGLARLLEQTEGYLREEFYRTNKKSYK